jgi:DNA-binding CsgD family transcriptional regulator
MFLFIGCLPLCLEDHRGKSIAMHIMRLNTNRAETVLQDMISRFEKATQNHDLLKIISESKAQFGLKNVAYLGYNLGNLSKREPFSIVTYSEEWINHYRINNYVEFDPVLKAVHKSILPLDWSTVEINSRKARLFFNEAIAAGVGRFGLSIPVQGRHGDYSVLSLTFDEALDDWNFFKTYHMRDFQLLAVYFHNSVLEINQIRAPVYDLSERELETLYWAACGKTAEETAIILGISKRGVRFHVGNVLTKLNAANIAHAVAKAINFRIINPPR